MNKYLSFIFASVLTLTGVQLSKASNPSDSLAIVSAKWERTSSLQGIQLKQASIEGLFGGKQSISILTIGRAEGYTAFIATTDSLTTTSQLAEQSRSSAAINMTPYLNTIRTSVSRKASLPVTSVKMKR